MNELTDTIRIQVHIDGEPAKDIKVTKAHLMSQIQLHAGELRFLLPAYRKCLMPDDSDEAIMFCELLANLLPKLYGIDSKDISVEDLLEKVDTLTQAILNYCAIMDGWVGREVRTIITMEE